MFHRSRSRARSPIILAASGLTLALAGGAPAPAGAEPSSTAAVCTPATSADFANVTYTNFGMQNNSTSSQVQIRCGGHTIPSSPGSSTLVQITVYDRNPTFAVCCTLRLQDLNGSLLSSAAPCSANGVSVASQILSHTFPGIGMIDVACNIPAKSGSNLSHIASIQMF